MKTIERKRETVYPDGTFRSAFAKQLDDKYRERMVFQELYRNDLYLSILWNPRVDKADKLADFFRRLGKAKEEKAEVDEESIRKLEDITHRYYTKFRALWCKKLSLYEHEGNVFSQQSEFIHQLVGGRRERVPLTWGTIASSVYSAVLFWEKKL
ncbi:type IV secretory pathway VirB4 component [Bartonella heixiaziensis]